MVRCLTIAFQPCASGAGSSASSWSCYPRGLADCFSRFTCLFSFSVFCGFFFSLCFFVSLALLMQYHLHYSRRLDRCKLLRDGQWGSLLRPSRIPAWHEAYRCGI